MMERIIIEGKNGTASPEFVKANEQLVSETRLTNVTEEIADQLLFPSWKSIRGLDRFIKICGARIKQLVEQDKEEYFVINSSKYVVVNTGMMNQFATDVLIMYRFNEKYQAYIAECVINSKQDYLNNGFTKEQTSKKLKPICFFDEGENLFNPTMDDFDINQNCLVHIIKERKERFSESVRNKNDSQLAGQIMMALDIGLKMQSRDHSFAKASFSGKEGNITWFMPLHIETSLGENPELVMAIRKTGEFYQVKTILPYGEDIQDRITALSLYRGVWA